MTETQNEHLWRYTATGVAALVAATTLFLWQAKNLTRDIKPSLPREDAQPPERTSDLAATTIDIRGVFTPGTGTPGRDRGSWPRFRGERFDNIAAHPPGRRLATDWRENPPQILWRVELGEGHAAPAVYDGRVYVLDYDEETQSDTLRCLSLDDGEEIWRRAYRVPMRRNHGLSRTIPAVTPDYVLTIGPRCHVMCVDTMTGDFLWGLDLQAEFGAVEPFWYTGQCPLIDGDVAVVAPAGEEILMAGFACATGEMLWSTPNDDGWRMSHSSIIPMTVEGVKMYVYCAIGGTVGVAAEGEDAGRILWTSSEWQPSVFAPSPVPGEAGGLFLTAGYGAGSALIRIQRENDQFNATLLDRYTPRDGLASEQQTPIFKDGLLYGITPKDAGGLRNQFVCVDFDTPREILATSGTQARFGLGPFLLVDDLFLILNDDGTLVLAEMSPTGYNEFSRMKILSGRDAWGPLALVGDRLVLRDDHTLVCLELPTLIDPDASIGQP